MLKTLVLFVFHEYHYRVEQFIQNAIFEDDNTDFIIICNNKNIDFEVPSYVKKIVRENIGYDFGGWSEGLLKDDLYKNYTHFIFVNSTVTGPYISPQYTGKWTDIYINKLNTNNIKLIGSTINSLNIPELFAHVQSYIFAMDKTTLEYLINCEIFSMTKFVYSYGEAVFEKEIKMSRKIIENKWNIGSLFKYYDGVDFTFTEKPLSEYKHFLNDIMFHRDWEAKIWDEYELVFVKGNRCCIKM
jgi:lipopolysaccharide biosynthesis protein